MHSYRQRFFALLLPISIVSTVISLFYFKNLYGYSITQTIPIASIFGFLIGAGISFVSAFIFLLPPKPKSQGIDLSHRKKSKESIIKTETSMAKKVLVKAEPVIEEVHKEIKKKIEKSVEKKVEKSIEKKITKKIIQEETKVQVIEEKMPTTYEMILLMDKGLAFEVIYTALRKHNMSKYLVNENKTNSISIQMPSEVIEIHIDNLTRHTSKILLQSIEYQKELRKIIAYIKAKEYASLQY
jgi:hypothetical protein